MAKKRMFSPGITVDSDKFDEMPQGSRLLYFYFGMRADDDGFIANPKTIMRAGGFSEDDLKLLIAKKFVIPFESGVIVIRHWRIHNSIRADRYTETLYQEEKAQLAEVNGMYLLIDIEVNREKVPENNLSDSGNQLATSWQPNGYADKIRLDKSSSETTTETTISTTTSSADNADSETSEIPTLEQVKAYIEQINSPVSAERFFEINETRNWKYKGEPINWKALIRIWEKIEKNPEPEKKKKPVPSHNAEAKELFEVYGMLCPSLPKAQRLTADRKKAVSHILNKGYTVEQIKQAFRMAEESPFLRGEKTQFHADFDWFFKKDKSGRDNLLKILEGKYTDSKPAQNQPSAQQEQPLSEEDKRFFKLFKQRGDGKHGF